MNLILVRSVYTETSTVGDLIHDHRLLCHTLEDAVRPAGIKIPKRTAIPAGRYRVIVNLSARFNKLMPLLLAVPMFTGVRIHGGNTDVDTEGCVLVAHQIVSPDRIARTAADEITELLRTSNEENFIEVINTFPYRGAT